MSTHAGIGYLQPDKTIEAVYCHFDGYLDHVGKILYKYYNGTRLIKQLVGYGDFSSLEAQPSDINFYGDRDSFSQTYSTEDFSREFDYNYVWIPAMRKWYVACRQTNYLYVPLSDALRGRFDNHVRFDIGTIGTATSRKSSEPVQYSDPQVSGGMNPTQQEIEDFFTGASSRIKGRKIMAAKDEEFEDPRLDELDDLYDRVEDDFNYVMTGIERLGREGMLDEAIELLHSLADTLDSAINIIGNDFESGSDINPEEV